jgi:hypothetical protein
MRRLANSVFKQGIIITKYTVNIFFRHDFGRGSMVRFRVQPKTGILPSGDVIDDGPLIDEVDPLKAR